MARPASDIAPRIIAAARERFLAEGVDGASLRAIASDARTSIGMVYYYFPTKDDLFFAVIEEIYVPLVAELQRALAPDAPVEARIRRLYCRFGEMSEVETTTLRLILREVLVSNDRLGRLLQRFQRGHIPLAIAMLRDGMQDGTLAPDLPPLLAAAITFVVGAAPQFLVRRAGAHLPAGGMPRESELADLLVRILLHGIGAGSGVQPQPRRAARSRQPPRRRKLLTPPRRPPR
jgi:AcrR family transcriptional regulator